MAKRILLASAVSSTEKRTGREKNERVVVRTKQSYQSLL
jgi:hypothetical protein